MESRHLFVLITLCSGALGCSGPDDKGDASDTDTDSGPVSFEFVPSVSAKSFVANVSEDAVAAHRVSSALLAATSIVVADQKVQDRLNVDGGGAGFRAAYLDCWTRPQFPMFSFSIDYTPCLANYDMGGGVFVEDHPSGPLLFNFEDFTVGAQPAVRTVGGTFALDTQDAFPQALFWQTYNTDGDNPHIFDPTDKDDTEVQIGVSLDRVRYGVSYSGGASIDFLNQEWSTWGVMTVDVDPTNPKADDVITVVHGARSAEEVAPDEPTGADVLKSGLDAWTTCRCPTSGISAYDLPLHFTSVTVDLDDLEVEPDATDDPDVELAVVHDVFGTGVLTHVGCGEYEVEYDSEPLTIPVTTEQLVGRISFLCDTLTIPDRQRCSAFVRAAQEMPAELQIEVSEADADQTALLAVDSDFDTTWCRIE